MSLWEKIVAVLLLPWVMLAAAAGGIYWLVWTLPFGHNEDDKERLADVAGLVGPEMEQHWQRLTDSVPDIHDTYEALKNIMSEWVRLDAQRGGKFLSLIAFLLLIGLVVEAVV